MEKWADIIDSYYINYHANTQNRNIRVDPINLPDKLQHSNTGSSLTLILHYFLELHPWILQLIISWKLFLC